MIELIIMMMIIKNHLNNNNSIICIIQYNFKNLININRIIH